MSRRFSGSGGKESTEVGLTIKITVPYPPSVNRLWRTNGKGATYSSPAYKAWQKEAQWAIIGQTRGRKIVGPYKMTIHVVRPDKRRRDLGNLEKALSDALVSSGFIEDDCNAERILSEWVPDSEGQPACEVIIET